MDTEMPGGMGTSQDKGKGPEPPVNPYQEVFDQAAKDRLKPPAPGGSGDPDPGAGITPPRTPPLPTRDVRKKHIKKPEDFMDTKNWDKFKHQKFLYYEEYFNEFGFDDATRIRFNLSFFVGGLPEKFAANFIDQIIRMSLPRWGSFADF